MKQKYYRFPWDEEKVATLTKWWPHFGSYALAEMLEVKRTAVKSKADKLQLKLLPKKARLCINCRARFQYARSAGLRCRDCHLDRRREIRTQTPELPLERWVSLSINTVRYRSKVPSDLSVEYMIELWHSQGGKCCYSGIEMVPPKYGSGRNFFSASIDRINPKKGYLKGNVAWACWICNSGKSDMSVEQYINVCKAVAKTWANQLID